MSIEFASKARQYFDPIAHQSGLSCVSSTEWSVRYESTAVTLVVHFDNERSYEIGVDFELKEVRPQDPPITLAEVLRLRGIADARDIDGMMVSQSGCLNAALARLAALTSDHATDFLLGDDLAFAQANLLRETASRAYALDRDVRLARSASEAAWIARNYRAVIDNLERIENYLSPAEKKRLAYARKHLLL